MNIPRPSLVSRPRFLALILASLLYLPTLVAQRPLVHQYTVDEGIPSMTIYRILQAQDGRLWLGTGNGLSRFDGFRFHNIGPKVGLPGSEVISMALDRRKRLWFATFNGGLGFWRGDSIHDHRDQPWIPQLERVPMGLGVMENGKVCIGTRDSIWIFNEQAAANYLCGHGLRRTRILADHGGDLPDVLHWNGRTFPADAWPDGDLHDSTSYGLPPNWWAFGDQYSAGFVHHSLLNSLDRDSAFVDFAQSAIHRACGDCHISAMAYDHARNIWAGTRGKGVYWVRRTDSLLVPVLEKVTVNTLICDLAGNIWLGTDGDGLLQIRQSELAALNLSQKDGLLRDQVDKLGWDENGNLLLGYFTGDWSRLAPHSHSLDHFPKLPGYANAKMKDLRSHGEGGLLISSEQSAYWVPDGRKKTRRVKTANLQLDYSEYHTPFGSESRTAYRYFHSAAIKDIAVASSERWFLASSEGLYACQMGDTGISCKRLMGIRLETVAWEAAKGRLWASSLDSLYLWQNGNGRTVLALDQLRSRVPHLLPDQRGGLWLGTGNNGLFFISPESFLHLDASDGLPSDVCTALIQTPSGEIWLGTDKGAARISVEASPPAVQVFDKQSGLADNYILDILQVGDTIWASTRHGISFILPSSTRHYSQVPRIGIHGIQISGRDTLPARDFRLPDWQNSIAIQFFDSTLTADLFQFRCLGVDTLWRSLSTPELSLPFLAPGRRYQVEFRARSGSGPWSSVISIDFDIRQAFFRSSAFYLLLAALLLAAAIGLLGIRQRNRSKIARQREKYLQDINKLRLSALKARMNPHFIFNSLNSIQHLVVEDDERATLHFISLFSKLMRCILDNSGEESITLKEELEVCRMYLDIEALRLNRNFEYKIEVDPSLSPGELFVPTMVLQPFLENAIWHGLMPKKGKRCLQVAVSAQSEGFEVHIEDNGIGRKAAAENRARKGRFSSVRSSSILAQRLSLLNQSMEGAPFLQRIEDLYDDSGQASGTSVRLQFPLILQPLNSIS